MTNSPHFNRRTFLTALAGVAGAGSVAIGSSQKALGQTPTKARIVIVGAGAAGLAMASQLSAKLDGASITLIDGRKQHFYQPGYTLVAAGLKNEGYPVSETAHWVARGADWIEEYAGEIDPVGNKVVTESGKQVPYDYLVIATGLKLDYDSIAGFDKNMIGKDGIGSVYAGAEAARATWMEMSRFTDQGGIGLFSRPATEMKCAGAPLKYTFITDDYARKKGTRGKTELIYAAHNKALFSVPIVSEKVRMLYQDRGIKTVYDHVLTSIDHGRKVATFKTPEFDEEIKFDFINVVPPMRAPDVVKNSPLGFAEGPLMADGWVEVDKTTLRHPRFANVFAVGDVAGVPKGKTAASVKWQVPVAADHLVATIEGKTSESAYNGYTSCPLITKIGRAMLVEFDYNNNLVPSFPGIIAPLEELWITWLMKEMALKPTYLAMLRGQA